MSAGHTPGPWFVGNGDVYAAGDMSSDYDDRVICAIGTSGGFRSHEYSVVKAHKPEGKANARLIAAAPDGLAFAKALDASWTELFPDGPDGAVATLSVADEHAALWRQCRAFIAKATGAA